MPDSQQLCQREEFQTGSQLPGFCGCWNGTDSTPRVVEATPLRGEQACLGGRQFHVAIAAATYRCTRTGTRFPNITRIAHGTGPRVISVAVRWKYIGLGIIPPRLIKSAGHGRLPSGIHAHAGIVVVRSSIMKIGTKSLSTTRSALGMRRHATSVVVQCRYIAHGTIHPQLTKSAKPNRQRNGTHVRVNIVVVRSSITRTGKRCLSITRSALGMRLIAIFADGPCGSTEVGENLRALTRSAFSSLPRSKFPVHSAASPFRFPPVFS